MVELTCVVNFSALDKMQTAALRRADSFHALRVSVQLAFGLVASAVMALITCQISCKYSASVTAHRARAIRRTQLNDLLFEIVDTKIKVSKFG